MQGKLKKENCYTFLYESKRRKEWREIRPYMIIPNGKENLELDSKENLELVGLPIEELNKEKKQSGHYLLDKGDKNLD